MSRFAENSAPAARPAYSTESGSGHLRSGSREAHPAPPGGAVLTARLDCLSCHAPHPNGRPFQLAVEIAEIGRTSSGPALGDSSQLCIECHEAFLQIEPGGESYTLHPVGIPAPEMIGVDQGGYDLPLEDVHGTADPGDDVIGCTTCHFAHDGPNPDLLRWGAEEMRNACSTCHRVGPLSLAEDLIADRRSGR